MPELTMWRQSANYHCDECKAPVFISDNANTDEQYYICLNSDCELVGQPKSIPWGAAVPEPTILHDTVNHPVHYTNHPSGVECINIVEHMTYCLGNAIKYIWRHDSKSSPIEDLRKAIWYIEREIERIS